MLFSRWQKRPPQPDNPAFYDFHWEETDSSSDPFVVAKGDRILQMMPEGIKHVVDVGCGDGYLTHRLAEHYDVIAVDRSPVALAKLRCQTVQASADQLPLADRSADVVFSSELLEHLPDAVYEGAIMEFSRVAKHYIFLSVPYRENVRRRFAQCPRCYLQFHICGHHRAFNEDVIDRAFPSFQRVATTLDGPFEPRTYPLLEWGRQRVIGHWFVWNGAKITCPRCGEKRFEKRRQGPLASAAERIVNRTTASLNHLRDDRGNPYWILAILKRIEVP